MTPLPHSARLRWPFALLELVRLELFGQARPERAAFTQGTLGLFFLLALAGSPWAVLAATLYGLITTVRTRPPWQKALIDVGAITVAMWVASHVITMAGALPAIGLQLAMAALGVMLYVALHQGILALSQAATGERCFWSAIQQGLLGLTGLSLGHAVLAAGWYALFLASPLVLLWLSYRRYAMAQHDHTRQLEGYANELIATLAAVVDARDVFTYGHSTQVARYAVAMGQELGYTAADLERLRVGALLHDIGKVGVPEAILYKPGKLEPWEYQKMKEHTAIGYRIVSKIARLSSAAQIIYQHHEWFNGQGYPRGLDRESILRDARVVGVADALEAIMSDRPYRKGRTLEEALAEIRHCTGTQFDPEVVGALERVVEREGSGFFVNAGSVGVESRQRLVAAAELH